MRYKFIFYLFFILLINSCYRINKFDENYINQNEILLTNLIDIINKTDLTNLSTLNLNKKLEMDQEYLIIKNDLNFKYIDSHNNIIFIIYDGFPPDTIWGIAYLKINANVNIFSKNDILKQIKNNWYYFNDV